MLTTSFNFDLIFLFDRIMKKYNLLICLLAELTVAHYPVIFSVHKNLQTYLEDVCSKTHSGKYLILINNLITKNDSRESLTQFKGSSSLRKSNILAFFKRYHCSHTFHSNITSYHLLSSIPQISKYYHRQQIVLIFEFTQFTQFSQNDELQHFHSIIRTLSYIYSRCLACAPLLVHFSHLSLYKIFTFSKLLFGKVLSDFQAVIFSAKINGRSKDTAVYFRPTLRGCKVENRVIMSKEGSKMIKEVKTPFQKCDFNFTTFKIAVNHVSQHFNSILKIKKKLFFRYLLFAL